MTKLELRSKTAAMESFLFYKVKKKSIVWFSCEFFETYQNSYFAEQLSTDCF